MNRLFVAHGPDGVVEAAEALLSSDEFDMAAVKDVFDDNDPLLDALDNGNGSKNRENTERLHAELPQLDVVHGIVTAMWAQKGYKGMHIADGFFLDQWRKAGIGTHIDGLVYGNRRIEAGLQLSLCLKGLREFRSERLDHASFAEDGTFDQDDFEELGKFNGTLQQEILAGRIPRTASELEPGDLAIFPHHPVISLHQANILQPGSVARLISYNAEIDA